MKLEATLIREAFIRYSGPKRNASEVLRDPGAAAAFARRLLKDDSREHFIAIYLDSRHRPIAYSVVSIGTATQSLVHPREVFQLAVGLGACALILLHNHPSGEVSESAEDREVTQRIAQAGEVLGIRVLDHIIFTSDGRTCHSFATFRPELLEAAR